MVAAIVLSPTHAKVGTTNVSITGSGFALTSAITFTYGGNPLTPTDAPITSDGAGAFVAHFTVPVSVEGIHAIVATDASLGTATANFTVDPGITLTPSTQKIGGSTTVAGSGFATLSAVVITIGGVTVTGVTTDVNGSFSQAETVPTLASGSKTVSATDAATNNATATLTVSAPTLVLTPNNGIVGSTTTCTGANYIPNASLTITNIDATTLIVTADSSGNIPAGAVLTIPAKAQGSHNITCTDATNTATTAFTVNSHLVISPTSGRIGSTATVTATGLAASSAITVEITATDMTPGGSPTSDSTGGYTGVVTIPTITSGAKTVTLTDASANAPTASFTVSAVTLVLSPTSGPIGTVVTLTGANYIPSHALTLTNTDGATTSATATSGGAIPASTTVTIESTEIGAQSITCGDGTNTGTATFTITPSLTLDPTSGPATTEVEMTGYGFAATSVIGVKIDGTTVVTAPTTITTDADGYFVATTILASLAAGAHNITCTDASSNAVSAIFTVSPTLVLNSIQNSGTFARVYKWAQEVEIAVDDDAYADAVVLDVRNAANVLFTLYNEGSNGLTYSTLGIIHESDNTVPPTDTNGIKKWVPIDTDVALATTVVSSKYYTSFLWSYILLRVKRTVSTDSTLGLFSAKTIDKNG